MCAAVEHPGSARSQRGRRLLARPPYSVGCSFGTSGPPALYTQRGTLQTRPGCNALKSGRRRSPASCAGVRAHVRGYGRGFNRGVRRTGQRRGKRNAARNTWRGVQRRAVIPLSTTTTDATRNPHKRPRRGAHFQTGTAAHVSYLGPSLSQFSGAAGAEQKMDVAAVSDPGTMHTKHRVWISAARQEHVCVC